MSNSRDNLKKESPQLVPVVVRYHGEGEAAREWTTRDLEGEVERAGGALVNSGLERGDSFVLGFGENTVEDLAFRLGAARVGVVPVTINWQADSATRVCYKVRTTGASAIVVHPSLDPGLVEEVLRECPGLVVIDATRGDDAGEVTAVVSDAESDPESPRLILFTSGTTGVPKGVIHSHRSYQRNRALFESFLEVEPDKLLGMIVVNPLHHANSSAICDWAMRRPGSVIELLPRYGRHYWSVLKACVEREPERLFIAPLVARHFDILESLIDEGAPQVAGLERCLKRVVFLLGSAPVGPTTIDRLVKLTGRVPTVRFGSTELCLQALGTPTHLASASRLRAFERGWDGSESKGVEGYYIGRPHRGFTEARIVHSVAVEHPDYLRECEEGESGTLVVKSACAMSGYHGQPEASSAVWGREWYLGLGDIGYWLTSEEDGEHDFYWVSRVSGLLIRGGANYSCEQISADLRKLVERFFNLSKDDFDIAVVGLKRTSEHEDDCCVTVELKTPKGQGSRDDLEGRLIDVCREELSKAKVPDVIRFGPIPRNFKGALLAMDLERDFLKWCSQKGI